MTSVSPRHRSTQLPGCERDRHHLRLLASAAVTSSRSTDVADRSSNASSSREAPDAAGDVFADCEDSEGISCGSQVELGQRYLASTVFGFAGNDPWDSYDLESTGDATTQDLPPALEDTMSFRPSPIRRRRGRPPSTSWRRPLRLRAREHRRRARPADPTEIRGSTCRYNQVTTGAARQLTGQDPPLLVVLAAVGIAALAAACVPIPPPPPPPPPRSPRWPRRPRGRRADSCPVVGLRQDLRHRARPPVGHRLRRREHDAASPSDRARISLARRRRHPEAGRHDPRRHDLR